MYDARTLATEAERLIGDQVLKQALADMRKDAVEELIGCDPYLYEVVIEHQTRVKTIDEFLSQLERYILAMPERE